MVGDLGAGEFGQRAKIDAPGARLGQRENAPGARKGASVRQARTAGVCGAVLAFAGGAAAQGVRTIADEGVPITITTQVRHTTTVVVPATETIVDVVAGDAEYWDVSASANLAYIKPLEAAASSNVTLVAESGRVWALLVAESGGIDPDLVVHIDPPATGPGTLARALPPAFTAAAALEAEHAAHADALAALHAVEVAGTAALAAVRAEHAAHAAAWRGAYPGRLQFPYVLEARARAEPFLVEALWHDGRFTYLRSRAQETPALYELTDGDPALVAYELHDDGLYVADHVLGPGRLMIGELWTEWGDVRPRPRQPMSKRTAMTWASTVVGGAIAVGWLLGR